MFLQIIQGQTKDANALRKRADSWMGEIEPDSIGWLGSTMGVTPDGEFVICARFESEDAARRNSDRPEQGRWWEETQKLYSGPVSFKDYADVDEWLKGGSNDAGFVQVIQGRTPDIEAVRNLTKEFDEVMPSHRPDVIGGITGWTGDGDFTQVVYFTSEAEARAGEKKEAPPKLREADRQMQALMKDISFHDLPEPLFFSP
jgi:hypothetical protein